MVKAAAVRREGRIYSLPPPARHCDCIKLAINNGETRPILRHEQGFLNHQGGFLSRAEAAEEAYDCMQISKFISPFVGLTSEDLW